MPTYATTPEKSKSSGNVSSNNATAHDDSIDNNSIDDNYIDNSDDDDDVDDGITNFKITECTDFEKGLLINACLANECGFFHHSSTTTYFAFIEDLFGRPINETIHIHSTGVVGSDYDLFKESVLTADSVAVIKVLWD